MARQKGGLKRAERRQPEPSPIVISDADAAPRSESRLRAPLSCAPSLLTFCAMGACFFTRRTATSCAATPGRTGWEQVQEQEARWDVKGREQGEGAASNRERGSAADEERQTGQPRRKEKEGEGVENQHCTVPLA